MDSSILDSMLNAVATACAGNGTIYGYAKSLFGYLIALDFVTVVLMNLLSFGGGQNFISLTITKIMAYGFWLWIIQSWGYLCNTVVNSLTISSTSFGSIPSDVLMHPSYIIDLGYDKAVPYFNYLTADTSWTNIVAKLGVYFLTFICACGLWLAFAIIAFQVFITYVEFYICSALMLLFLPFAVNKYTERFAQNCIGGVFSHGVKLMFLGAIISLSGPMLNTLNTNFVDVPTWDHLFSALLAPWAIAFLCWQAPSMAAGFMSGGPAISAAMTAQNISGAMSAAGSGLGVGMAIGAGVASATASAVRGGSQIAGAAVGGGKSVDENTMPITGAAVGVAKLGFDKAVQAFSSVQDNYQKGYDTAAGGKDNNSNSSGPSMGEGNYNK
ncbi:MAG: type IV secretion system protein [Phascolarctobacterium sp.]|nr:type IV secretion system protein [Phascolarctobacterium sp.]